MSKDEKDAYTYENRALKAGTFVTKTSQLNRLKRGSKSYNDLVKAYAKSYRLQLYYKNKK